MSPAILVRLRPTTPWRTGSDSGERERTEAIYHSDALFSAVCSAMERLGRLDEWLAAAAPAEGEPAVRFSSCFPFQGDTLYFAPPRHLWPPAAASRLRWKSARFVPRAIVERLLAGKGIEEERWTVDASSQCLLAVDRRGTVPTPFRIAVRTAAAVDRLGSGAVAPHSMACLEFSPDAGLWFLVLFQSDQAREQWSRPVQAALRLLADTGFGGGRSRGWGRCQMPDITEGELPGLLLRLDLPRPPAERKAPAPQAVPETGAEQPSVTAAPPVEEETAPETESLAAPAESTPEPVPNPTPAETTGPEPQPEPQPVTESAVEPGAATSQPVEPAPSTEEAETVQEAETTEAAPAEPEPIASARSLPSTPVAHLVAPPPPSPPGVAYWLLSLFSPSAADEVDWERGAYSVLERHGRVDSPSGSGARKRPARMVTEGSVIVASGLPQGAAADVAPEGHPHPVYRSGYAVSIVIPWRSV